MWLKVCFILSFSFYISAYDSQINWLIPDKKVVLPEKFKTQTIGISLPPMKRYFDIADKNLGQLKDAISTGVSFLEVNNPTLYPLFELGLRLKALIKSIYSLISEFKRLFSPNPTIFGINKHFSKTTIEISGDELLPDFEFVEYSYYISHINNHKNLMPGKDTIDNFRNSAAFHRLETSTALLTVFLQDYKNRLLKYYYTLRYLAGNVDSIPSSELFITELVEMSLKDQFDILSLLYFEGSLNKIYVILEVAIISEKSDFQHYVGVTYGGYKISNELYGRVGSNSLYEVHCYTKNICVPSTSKCSESLLADNFTDIVKFCNFQKSMKEYFIVLNIGILINYEPTNKKLISYLKTKNVSLPSFPVLMTLNDCLTLDDQENQFCFNSDFDLITSGLDPDLISKTFNPTWEQNLETNLNDIPTILTALIFMIISFLIFFLGKIFNNLGKRMTLKSNKTKNQPQRHRNRPIPNDKIRPIIHEMRELHRK